MLLLEEMISLVQDYKQFFGIGYHHFLYIIRSKIQFLSDAYKLHIVKDIKQKSMVFIN
jgi:hypothetical protein